MYRILIPIDPSEYTKAACNYAAAIAAHREVSLKGIAIIDDLNIEEAAITLVPLPQGSHQHEKLESSLLEDAQKKARQALDEFDEFCKSNNLINSGSIEVGRPDMVIEAAGKYSDLIVTGMRNFFHFETSKHPEKTASKIITQTQTPVLVVPKQFNPISRVLIAFDGSNPALKAVKEFVKIEWDKKYEITLLVSHRSKTAGDDLLGKVEEYLMSKTNNHIHKVWTDKKIIKAFDEEYKDKTDLVVCGMHSQSILKKLMLGSFPEYLINLNKIPVLISQ